MSFARLPLSRALRTLLFGMLALAIVAKPVLAEFCNAHALSHLVAESGGPADAGAGPHVDSDAEARSDRDHASGKHQGLHAFDASPGYVEPFPALAVPPARHFSLPLPAYVPGAPPADRIDSLFRPPIC